MFSFLAQNDLQIKKKNNLILHMKNTNPSLLIQTHISNKKTHTHKQNWQNKNAHSLELHLHKSGKNCTGISNMLDFTWSLKFTQIVYTKWHTHKNKISKINNKTKRRLKTKKKNTKQTQTLKHQHTKQYPYIKKPHRKVSKISIHKTQKSVKKLMMNKPSTKFCQFKSKETVHTIFRVFLPNIFFL